MTEPSSPLASNDANKRGTAEATKYASIGAPWPKRAVTTIWLIMPITRINRAADPRLSRARKIFLLTDLRRTATRSALVVLKGCALSESEDWVMVITVPEKKAKIKQAVQDADELVPVMRLRRYTPSI